MPDSDPNVVVRVWRGQARLGTAFWGMCVLGQLLLWAAIAAGLGLLKLAVPSAFSEAILAVLVGFAAGFLMWCYCIVGLWRCAFNTDRKVLGVLARLTAACMVCAPGLLYAFAWFQGSRRPQRPWNTLPKEERAPELPD